jgi:methionyl-tRNA formyltransferase
MLRVGFVTCVQLGLSCMEEIYRVGGRLDLAVTLLDEKARQKSGRVYLDGFCASHSIPLLKVSHVNDESCLQAIRDAGLDWLLIIGWSQIAGPAVLAAPRRGAIGIHPALLPEGRGRAAIPWAILKGLSETGVTMFQLDAGVDTGPILAQERLPLAPDETACSLYARVNEAHRTLIAKTWCALVDGTLQARPQDDSKATFWPGRKPEDGAIAGPLSVSEVDRLVRAVTRPYPGAFLDCDGGTRITVWSGRPVDPSDVQLRPQLVIRCSDGCYAPIDFEISSRAG